MPTINNPLVKVIQDDTISEKLIKLDQATISYTVKNSELKDLQSIFPLNRHPIHLKLDVSTLGVDRR